MKRDDVAKRTCAAHTGLPVALTRGAKPRGSIHNRRPLMRVLYLGISGVLHPSVSRYKLIRGRTPSDDGHQRYEAVPLLTSMLTHWPDVRIVLTSAQPWKLGLPAVLEHFGLLRERVIGFTYEDLTATAMLEARTRNVTIRYLSYGNEDYWRMNKSDIVTAHVDWLHPEAWVAVDDENILWPKGVSDHVCIVDGCEGLKHPVEQDKLLTCLRANFGPEE